MSDAEPPDQHAGDSAPPAQPRPQDDGMAPQAAAPAGPPATPPPAESKPHRSRGWIAATVILLLALIGIGAWALSLRADNDDKERHDRLPGAAAPGAAGRGRRRAGGREQLRRRGPSDAGRARRPARRDPGHGGSDPEDAQAAIDEAEQAAADAAAKAESAGDDVEKAEAEAEAAKADAEATTACARGYLDAIKGALDAGSIDEGVAQARSEIEALSGSCTGLLGG